MTGQILYFVDLQRICEPDGPPPRLAAVVQWAEREGIRYRYDRRGRIWTTLEAINAAMGLRAGGQQEQHIDMKELI
jgi:hypothetical protein